MRLLIAISLAWAACTPIHANAQTSSETELLKRAEDLRKAMIDADGKALDELTSDKLSYGHSSLRIEDKKEFIRKLVSGESDFLSMELSEMQVTVSGKTALLRCKLTGETMDDGKPNKPRLHVLMVWQKKGGRWRLLERQAVKIP